MNKTLWIITTLSGALAVGLGAMGAHALKMHLGADQLASFETAVRYQFIHTLVLLALLIAQQRAPIRLLRIASWLFVVGIVLFSGSIYLLSTREMTGLAASWLGPITPIGGLFFIAGWLVLLPAGKRLFNDSLTHS